MGESQVVCSMRSVHLSCPWLRALCNFTLHQLTTAGCCYDFQRGWHFPSNSERNLFLKKLPFRFVWVLVVFLVLCFVVVVVAVFTGTISNYGSNLSAQNCLCCLSPSRQSLLTPEVSNTTTTSSKRGLRSLNILWQPHFHTRMTGID